MEEQSKELVSCVDGRSRMSSFICGSIPIPLDAISLHDDFSPASSLSNHVIRERSSQRVFKLVQAEESLDSDFPGTLRKTLPSKHVRSEHWGGDYLEDPVSRKCERLAVEGLAEFGEKVDIIAPAEVLKEIFKLSYCSDALSIIVHRIGRSLILSKGYGPDEAENLEVARSSYSISADTGIVQSLEKDSRELVRFHELEDDRHLYGQIVLADSASSALALRNGFGQSSFPSRELLEPSPGPLVKAKSTFKRSTFPSEDIRGIGNFSKDDPASFLRVLLWKFKLFRILVGSDLMVFSNERHSAVSLHLMDIEQEHSPLAWLNIWLENIMANLEELAVCYHRKGVVQGYELLETDDILQIKGLSKDGTPLIHPLAVQTKAHAVLRFLQESCSDEPGTYLLRRRQGCDQLELFDVAPSKPSPCSSEGVLGSAETGKDMNLPLAMLLYRLGLRLSKGDGKRCIGYLDACIQVLDGNVHPGVKATAHEYIARFLLDMHQKDLSSHKLKLLEAPARENKESDREVGTDQQKPDDIEEVTGGSLMVDGRTEEMSEFATGGVQTHLVPVDSQKPSSVPLRAVYHATEAVKSLQRQRDLVEEMALQKSSELGLARVEAAKPYLSCICGEQDCTPFQQPMEAFQAEQDDRMHGLFDLLGNSYIALSHAYKLENLLHNALRAAESAAEVAESTEESFPVSSALLKVLNGSFPASGLFDQSGKRDSPKGLAQTKSTARSECSIKRGDEIVRASRGSFWGRLWAFMGDLYLEIQRQGPKAQKSLQDASSQSAITVDTSVREEMKRLKTRSRKKFSNTSSIPAKQVERTAGKNQKSKRVDEMSEQTSQVVEAGSDCIADRRKGQDSVSPFGHGLSEKERGSCEDVHDSSLFLAISLLERSCTALAGIEHLKDEWEEVVKKHGWALNELGRRYLQQNRMAEAEQAFGSAIKSFREVKDVTNIVLVMCNVGHAKRSIAEDIVCGYSNNGDAVIDVRGMYMESLKWYSDARKELLREGSQGRLAQSWTTANMQLGHTYLRLAMLLSREEVNRRIPVHQVTGCFCTTLDVDTVDPNKKLLSTEAFLKAIFLYESLDGECAQESAFGHYQLASHLFAILRQSHEALPKKTEGKKDSSQGISKLLSLAVLHWKAALEHYKPATYPDMFVTIFIEQADGLSFSHEKLQGLEAKLCCLLETKQAFSSETLPSARLQAKIIEGIQGTLKEMLGTLMVRGCQSKPAGSGPFGDTADSAQHFQGTETCWTIDGLKSMYRKSLALRPGSTLRDGLEGLL